MKNKLLGSKMGFSGNFIYTIKFFKFSRAIGLGEQTCLES